MFFLLQNVFFHFYTSTRYILKIEYFSKFIHIATHILALFTRNSYSDRIAKMCRMFKVQYVLKTLALLLNHKIRCLLVHIYKGILQQNIQTNNSSNPKEHSFRIGITCKKFTSIKIIIYCILFYLLK